MDRVDALKELLAKVEAGDLHKQEYGGMPLCTACYIRDEKGSIIAGSWHDANVMQAYHGSLDAAKSLHDAVLGDGYVGRGFHYTIYGSGKVSVWNIITEVSGRGEVNGRDLHSISPARAWLIAILKALIAQETAQ